jgi:hypothetical protein
MKKKMLKISEFPPGRKLCEMDMGTLIWREPKKNSHQNGDSLLFSLF